MRDVVWTRVFVVCACLVVCCSCATGHADSLRPAGVVRVATYNLQWFSEDAHPGRIAHIKAVLAHIDPDIVGLQEIQSERALRQVFDDTWSIGITDDPQDVQELAIAVRRPYVLVSSSLLFRGASFEDAFPRGRDVLRCVVQSPGGKQIVVYVVHMKSRRGGRLATDPAREMACGLLAAYLNAHKSEVNSLVLGDFNDAPDDVSLNILESGDLMAQGGSNEKEQRLLVNLTEPLAAKDYATEGVYSFARPSDPSAIVPGSKSDNDRLRGKDYDYPRDVKVPQTFFDQILVNPHLADSVSRVEVHAESAALEGSPGKTLVEDDRVVYAQKGDLASDHLPVSADVKIDQFEVRPPHR